MRPTLPFVETDHLFDYTPPGQIILLDSPAWFRWLAESTTTRFAYCLVDHAHGYIVGRLTVRKECRQRGDVYWSTFRRRGGRVRKFYLGRSETLTRVRLERIAAQVMDPAGDPPAPQNGPADLRSGHPRIPRTGGSPTTGPDPPPLMGCRPPIRSIGQTVDVVCSAPADYLPHRFDHFDRSYTLYIRNSGKSTGTRRPPRLDPTLRMDVNQNDRTYRCGWGQI
jgi:hypothetical protein